MATKKANKILEIEKQYNKPIRQILIDTYEKTQSLQEMAKIFGVSQGTVSNWILKCGLSIKSELVAYNITEKGKQYLNGNNTTPKGNSHETH